MKRLEPTLLTLTSLVILSCAMLALWLVFWPGASAAQAPPPPPPPNTPTNTPVTPDQPTSTPITPDPPTNTPVTPDPPTNTPVTPDPPTNTPVTPDPPTNTPAPSDTAVPPTPKPTKDSKPAGGSEGRNSDCQSRVEGSVIDASGQGVKGATVSIRGEGWSSGILTNDNGQYGFAGLCAGTATLSATLPNGQPGATATVSFDGQNNLYLDLGVSQGGETTPTASTGTPAAPQQTPVVEADMPATGFSGWLLAGAGLLGALLLVSAGLRRGLLTSQQQRED
jgi:cytoskeletal protein RodZ